MGFFKRNNPTNGRQPGGNTTTTAPPTPPQQVEQTLSHVHFGVNKRQAFKEWAGEVWDIAAPLVLLAGTAGEVFFFIWNNTAESTAWWVAISVLATVIVLEATFAVVSYKSSTLRNRADRRPGGRTALDKAILNTNRLLKQRNEEVKIINTGTLELQRTHAQAVIDRDNTETEIRMSKMENATRLQNHKTMQEQADTMNRLGQGMLRAIFDPEMPDDQRQKMLQSLEMLVNMSKMLPPPTEGRIERIEEED